MSENKEPKVKIYYNPKDAIGFCVASDDPAEAMALAKDMKNEYGVVTPEEVQAVDQAVAQAPAPTPAPQPQAQGGTCPQCQSALNTVPGGVSKRTGKSYPSFLSCSNQNCDHTQNI